MTQDTCSACGAQLESALVCEGCGALVEPGLGGTDPFAVFGLEPTYAVDTARLRKRLVGLSRQLHPDYFSAAADHQRALAERSSAELNAAHDVLASDVSRADQLVRAGGGPTQSEERDMPQDFLMEVLEWNETLEAARHSSPGSAEREALRPLAEELETKRAESLAAIAAALEPLPARADPAYTDVRRHLNAVRYVDRALGEIRELGLQR